MVSLTNKFQRQKNTSTAYQDCDFWIYGPYKLVPMSKATIPGVALPGGVIITIPELRRMAAQMGWTLRAPTSSWR